MRNTGDTDLKCFFATQRKVTWLPTVAATVLLVSLSACITPRQSGTTQQYGMAQCGPTNTITADVVALEQVYSYNRLGAVNPAGLVYALKRDVVKSEDDTDGVARGADQTSISITDLEGDQLAELAGKVALRPDKRPRPLVLRAHVGDCLRVNFTNLLAPNINTQEVVRDLESGQPKIIDSEEPVTRRASMHVNGLNYVGSIESDGANVGTNESSLAEPGETKTYVWYAKAEGGYLFYSMGAAAGGEGDGGQLGLGLFGSVNVAPKGAKFYRSQVTESDMQLV